MALFSLFCQEDDPFSEEQPIETAATAAAASIEPFSDDLIASLVSGEQKSFPSLDRTYLRTSARREAVSWVARTCSRHGFGAPTALLAADYLDRCFLSSPCLLLQEDKPWMKQLSAVACLSLAAKVEETYVPFLVDLQLGPSPSPPEQETEVSGFLFESKTIKRMELLVLSTLGWKMNPATAHSFLQCIVSKLRSCDDPLQILRVSEAILVSVVDDWRWVSFPPSVWAAAALLQTNAGAFDELHQLMEVLEISKERVEECHGVIVEIMGSGVANNSKRKSYHCCDEPPPSPKGVISTCFSYESSSSMDSWPMWPSSVSSSPEPAPPPAKRAHFE
ncbi:cyclin-D3-3-like [Iris pallida]|uniref:Cyclin-D3-3-like n=1 Tax=Iris pallida TaxID=29817 RepID=A0AAX6H091_IRIPA|nr:cyclin-D3-3-like [Iris pallida]